MATKISLHNYMSASNGSCVWLDASLFQVKGHVQTAEIWWYETSLA